MNYLRLQGETDETVHDSSSDLKVVGGSASMIPANIHRHLVHVRQKQLQSADNNIMNI
jgi:hypothetical protein